MKKIKILVACHKECRLPDDNLYLPLHVGAKGKQPLGLTSDDSGDNISVKNPNFCELTGIYWAWKNLKADYIGLVHYRRYFSLKRGGKNEDRNFANILSREECEKLLDKKGMILPKKRRYFIENLYNHYAHTMYVEPLDATREIIAEKYPEYLLEFERLHRRTSAHMFNMFVMSKEDLNDYCEWLFDILFELEERFQDIEYNAFHARFYGRISELLLDVWINTNQREYAEVGVIDMQGVDWPKKIMSFLKAKFAGAKYEGSF